VKKTRRYIKSKKLNAGRKISPDGKLAAATKAGSFDMMKCARVLFPTHRQTHDSGNEESQETRFASAFPSRLAGLLGKHIK